MIANINNHRTFVVESSVIVEGSGLDEKTGYPITYRVTFSVGEMKRIAGVDFCAAAAA